MAQKVLAIGLFFSLHAPCLQWSSPEAAASYMRRCIALAKEAEAKGGGPYGALIVNPATGVVVEGRNHASHDPIWHGEMAAIHNLSLAISPKSVYSVAPGLELYTSAEPCPMCMSAIAWSGFGRVVYGTSIPFIESHGGEQINLRAAEVVARSPHNILLDTILHNETDPLYVRGAALHRHHDHNLDHAFRELSAPTLMTM